MESTYIYIANKTKDNQKTTRLAGIIHARNPFEALHNARIESTMRGASPRFISLSKLS